MMFYQHDVKSSSQTNNVVRHYKSSNPVQRSIASCYMGL